MAHLNFAINDLGKTVQHVIHCGATIAEEQFTDDWRVMLSPPAEYPLLLLSNEAHFRECSFCIAIKNFTIQPIKECPKSVFGTLFYIFNFYLSYRF